MRTQPDELLKLIKTEINLAHTFLRTHEIASGENHQQQALQNAKTAYETVIKLSHMLPEEQTLALQQDLQALAAILEERLNTPENKTPIDAS